AHSEETPHINSGLLSGVQLWIALPDRDRDAPPAFDHHRELPIFDSSGVTVRMITGDLLGHSSPAKTYTPLIGAEFEWREDASMLLPFKANFEHALFVFDGVVLLNNQRLAVGSLHYLSPGRDEMQLAGRAGSRLLLIGGQPFPEPIVMWWNFVA